MFADCANSFPQIKGPVDSLWISFPQEFCLCKTQEIEFLRQSWIKSKSKRSVAQNSFLVREKYFGKLCQKLDRNPDFALDLTGCLAWNWPQQQVVFDTNEIPKFFNRRIVYEAYLSAKHPSPRKDSRIP